MSINKSYKSLAEQSKEIYPEFILSNTHSLFKQPHSYVQSGAHRTKPSGIEGHSSLCHETRRYSLPEVTANHVFIYTIQGEGHLNTAKLSIAVECYPSMNLVATIKIRKSVAENDGLKRLLVSWYHLLTACLDSTGEIQITEDLFKITESKDQKKWLKEKLIQIKETNLDNSDEMKAIKQDIADNEVKKNAIKASNNIKLKEYETSIASY